VYLLCSFALVIGLTVAFATFFKQGFNALLPPDPTRDEPHRKQLQVSEGF
jgi:hypothetical protein